MRLHRPLLVLVVACGLAAPAQAQTLYDVEIIIFEHRDARASEQERWRPRVVLPALAEATAFERGGARADELQPPPRGFQSLPAERSQLDEELERLEDSERFRVLRHILWRQPALEADEAVAVRVRAGEPAVIRVPPGAYTTEPGRDDDTGGLGGDDDGAGDTLGRESPSAEAGDATVTPSDDAGIRAAGPFGGRTPAPRRREIRAHPLDGTIRLVVTRYLHVHADLYYTTAVEWLDDDARAPGSPATGADGPTGSPDDEDAGVAGAARAPRLARDADGRAMLSYPFVQRRRMRSNELHYLDHPVLGMLVWVTPRTDGDDVPDAGAS